MVPDDPTIPNDCYVAVQAQVAGTTSNTISISKTSDGSACQSTLGLTTADLATLDGGGTVGLAQLTISASVGRPLSRVGFVFSGTGTQGFARIESADFTPSQVNAAQAAQISGTVVADDVFYGCTASPASLFEIVGAAFLANPFDFGNKVTLQGSGGKLNLTSPIPGGILFTGSQSSPIVSDPSQLPSPLFTPGTWTFSGNGGTASPGSQAAAVFSVPLTLPPEIMATNFSALQTINRQQDLMVAWNPAGFGEQDVLTVTLSGNAIGELFTGPGAATCKELATGGQIVVPAAMVQYLAPSKSGSFLELSVTRKPGNQRTFSLALASGSSLPAVLQFTSFETWPVTVE